MNSSSTIRSNQQYQYEDSFWSPKSLTKEFDWDTCVVLQLAEQADLQMLIAQYFGLHYLFK